MNILLLAPHPFYSNRGTPIAVKQVCEALSEMGHQVDVLTYHEGESVEIPRVRVHRIARPKLVGHVPIGPSWQKLVCDVAMARKLRSMLAASRYDLIHAVEESAFLAVRSGLPFVFDMDSLMSRQVFEKSALYWPVAKLFERLEREAMRRSVGVLAVCRALEDEARKHQANVHLLPDLALAGTAAGELPEAITAARGTRLMYVGNLERYQGVDLMLDAFALAAARRHDGVLIVVGGSAGQIHRYRRRTESRGVAGRVRFAGPVPVDRLGRVLEHADVLVSPRIRGENTPMKLYSYLLSGKPVLATRLATHTQAVSDEQAVLVEPTPAAMAEGMIRLMESTELRERIGGAGRELALRCYTPAAFRRRLEAFYQGVARAAQPSYEGITR